MNVVGDQKHLVSINIVLQKEANATLVRTNPGIMLLPNACVKGAIKQKVLLIINSIHVAMATDALTCGWFHREPPISFNPERVRAYSLNLIKANKVGESRLDRRVADIYSAN